MFIFLLLAISSIEASPEVECPEIGEPYVPHPTDCSLFYQCNGDIPILMECPDGLYFDPSLNVCNWPDLVDCQNKDCTSLVGISPLAIEKANQLEVLPVWGPEFELKVDVKFQTWNRDWGNIFHLTNKSELNCCEVGTRVPALWTKRGTRNQLTLKTAIDSDGSKIFENELGTFETGQWYSFVISQSKDETESYYFDVTINGVRKVHIKNNIPRTFTNVEVFAGGKNHAAANAEIRNFQACQLL